MGYTIFRHTHIMGITVAITLISLGYKPYEYGYMMLYVHLQVGTALPSITHCNDVGVNLSTSEPCNMGIDDL